MALQKIVAAQNESIKNTESVLAKLMKQVTDPSGGAFDEKSPAYSKIMKLFNDHDVKQNDLMFGLEKLKQAVALTAELAKPAVQIKALSARVEFLTKEIETLRKEQVTSADLKAMEKRVYEAMDKNLREVLDKRLSVLTKKG